MSELERRGFTVLPSFAPDVERMKALVTATLTEPVAAACERPHNTLVPLRWSDELVAGALASKPSIAAIRAATGARDLRWVSAYISVKEGPSPPLWWHQDWWCWKHPASYAPRPPQVAVLCYLVDTSAEAAALRVLPGTHRRSVELHALLPGEDAEPLPIRHAALRDHRDQRTLSLRAGDAVVLDYRLLHGTHANESGTARACVILNFAPDWSSLPDDIRAHLIRHPALPQASEKPPAALARLLPAYAGVPRDLPLSRRAPDVFGVEAILGS